MTRNPLLERVSGREPLLGQSLLAILTRTITFFVIACQDALRLATPMTVIAGRGLDGIDLRLTGDTLSVRARYRGPRLIHLGFTNDVYEFTSGTRAFTFQSEDR
jgi:hypothetical protein